MGYCTRPCSVGGFLGLEKSKISFILQGASSSVALGFNHWRGTKSYAVTLPGEELKHDCYHAQETSRCLSERISPTISSARPEKGTVAETLCLKPPVLHLEPKNTVREISNL